jgi:hypothetical protein
MEEKHGKPFRQTKTTCKPHSPAQSRRCLYFHFGLHRRSALWLGAGNWIGTSVGCTAFLGASLVFLGNNRYRKNAPSHTSIRVPFVHGKPLFLGYLTTPTNPVPARLAPDAFSIHHHFPPFPSFPPCFFEALPETSSRYASISYGSGRYSLFTM